MTVKQPGRPRAMPIPQWPEADRRLWQRALAKRSVLDDASVATRWRPITQRGVAKSWGHWLGFLDRHDSLDASAAPASRVTTALVQTYVDDLRARGLASATIHMRVLHVSRFLEATDAGSCPASLHRFIRRLSAAKIPVRDDRSKLKPAHVLVDLGHRLIARAETDTSQSLRRRAATCRDGLIILILCCCPVRVGNLGALQVGLSLVREGCTWWLRFNADQAKGKRPINLPLPGEVTPLIDRYVGHWRPVLLAAAPSSGDTGFLWLRERDGTPLKKLGDRIASLTRTELGQSFNAHLFRKLATTELSIRDPAHVGAAQALLGHARYETTQKAYNLSRTIDAARKVQATLAKLRARDSISPNRRNEPWIRSTNVSGVRPVKMKVMP